MADDVVADDVIVIVDGDEARTCVFVRVDVEPTAERRDAISFVEILEEVVMTATIFAFCLGQDTWSGLLTWLLKGHSQGLMAEHQCYTEVVA